MKKMYAVSVLCLLLASTQTWADTLNFDDQTVNTATPDIVMGGVNVSFTNLITIEVGSSAYGFGSNVYGFNTVYNDTVNFSGNFLTDINDETGLPYARASTRPENFARSIRFDTPVSDVAMYIADVDVYGVWLNALDSNNNVLGTLTFSLSGGDALLRYASFAGYSGISQIQIIGRDPIGIDTLSFTSPMIAAPVPEPETYGMMLAGLGLLGTMARRRKQQEPTA
ncbi:MAG: FxDxF family PEP-CTERM protein [Sideroxyarcus sp.]|nr:FxDxF family PEP-CTERM protein [Sideroxyarcus sp.]